jgi:hypothetical protein
MSNEFFVNSPKLMLFSINSSTKTSFLEGQQYTSNTNIVFSSMGETVHKLVLNTNHD